MEVLKKNKRETPTDGRGWKKTEAKAQQSGCKKQCSPRLFG
jgi:hypothetical protein